MRKLFDLIIILLALSISSECFAQTTKTGTTSAQVLKFNVGPRAIGMGGAFTAIADDITAIYWNPGGTANINSNEVFFDHTSLYSDIRHDFGAFATNISGLGTVGLFVSVLSMDEMKVRTIEYPEGTGEFFNYSTFVMGLNFSRFLTPNFAIGFNVKYINENLWHMNSAGFAVDIPIFNELRIASSISNYGTKMQLSGRDVTVVYPSGAGDENLVNSNIELEKFDLPLIFRFGLSADVIKSGSSRVTVAVDAIHPNDDSEYLNTGLEYSWNEIVFLRGGFNSLFEVDSEKRYTFGVGLNYRIFEMVKMKVDFAYQDFGRLKSVYYFSVGIVF
jgi:hypothetical protein